MMNKLIFSIIFGLGVLLSNIAEAKPLTMDQALEAVCRISTSGARGSGTVFGEDKDKYFILTNGHVIERARKGHVEFFQSGYKSARLPFKTEYVAYKDGTALDLAIISVKKKYFGRYPPRIIPLAPKGTEIKPNDYIMAGGCPSGQWAMAWYGRIIRNTGAVVSFNAAPIGGQSGSGVLVLIKDEKGELQTRIGVLLAWRVGDGAWTDDGPNDYGAGLSLKQIYEIIEGNGHGHPIETSYRVVHEGHDHPKEKISKPQPERMKKACPHCKQAIGEHIIIPEEGGLRKTSNGEFIYCPILTLEDGRTAKSLDFFKGIKVKELYNGEGLFPWCPFNNPCPPPPNPQPPGGGPDNPPDGGGGFNSWPGRPDPGGPVEPGPDFDKERQEYLDKIAELKEKLTNLEALHQSLQAELSGVSGNLSSSQNEINGLKDLLGRVEGEKSSLSSRIENLLVLIGNKDKLLEGSGHYLDDMTGGNGNTVENVSLTLGGMSLGALALKYGVPLVLGRIGRRRRRKEEEEEEEENEGNFGNETEGLGYNSDGDCDCESKEHKHVHEHYHKYEHPDGGFVMTPDELPNPQTTYEIDENLKHQVEGDSGLNPGFVPYGLPVSAPYYQQPVAAHGLPPQFINIPFATRKKVSAEQIMTVIGELVNEYSDDQTMTVNQINTLLRQRLKEKFNVE